MERAVSGQRSGIRAVNVLDNPVPSPRPTSASGSTQHEAAAKTAPKHAKAPSMVIPAPVRSGVAGDSDVSRGMVL